VGGGFLGIIALLILTALSLVSGAEQVANGAVAGASKVNDAIGGSLGGLVDAVAFGRGQIVQTVILAANEIAATAIVIVLSVLISFYLLRDGASLWHRLLGNARPAVRPELDAAGGRAFEVLGGYMSGTAVVSFVGAFSQLVIMVVLGIDFALPVFVLSFFLCFIPYIGGFISTGIALLLTVAVGSTTDIAVMIVWTLVFNIVTGNIVSPLVYGRTVHLHPAIVLVAIPAGAAIAGILGMFMVVPVLGIISATWRTVLAAMGAPSGDAGSAFQTNDIEAEAAAADTIDTIDAPPLAADSAPA
jgi:predicted PurR-regulated permease PerM